MKNFVSRPWGGYIVIAKEKNYLIKKLMVNPSSMLSYQSHKFRSEHWVVIEGKAKVILENKINIISKNENIYIPKKAKHRIINTSKVKKLIIIEIQTGIKFLENDIKRFSDIYGRIK